MYHAKKFMMSHIGFWFILFGLPEGQIYCVCLVIMLHIALTAICKYYKGLAATFFLLYRSFFYYWLCFCKIISLLYSEIGPCVPWSIYILRERTVCLTCIMQTWLEFICFYSHLRKISAFKLTNVFSYLLQIIFI
jgi:hypothetical protein